MKAAEDAAKALDAEIAKAQEDGNISADERSALENQKAEADKLKAAADAAVKALPDSNTAKQGLTDRVDAIDNSLPTTDAQSDAEAKVKAAEDAAKALDEAIKAAEADGEITADERANLEAEKAKVDAAKDAADAAVKALPDDNEAKAGLQDRVNDINNDLPTTDAQADAEAKVKAAEDAAKALDDAIKAAKANDGKVTPDEVVSDKLVELKATADATKAVADEAVKALPDSNSAKQSLQDRVNALVEQDITPPTLDNVAVDSDTNKVTGHTEPGATVTLKDKEGKVIGTAKADNDGLFSIDIPLDDQPGDKLSLTAEDKANNVSAPQEVTSPDHTAPDLTDVTLANGKITGHTEAGATVVLKDEQGYQIGSSITADEDGYFSFDVPEGREGQTLQVMAVDNAGNPSPTEDVKIPSLYETKITGFEDNVNRLDPVKSVAITDFSETFTTDDNKPEIKGIGQPGETVYVYEINPDSDMVLVGTAEVGEAHAQNSTHPHGEGDWSITPNWATNREHKYWVTTEKVERTTPEADMVSKYGQAFKLDVTGVVDQPSSIGAKGDYWSASTVGDMDGDKFDDIGALSWVGNKKDVYLI